jgi:hypothetical protein
MSASAIRLVGAASKGHLPSQHYEASSDMTNPQQDTLSKTVVQNNVEEDSLAAACREEVISPVTFGPHGKEKNSRDLDLPVIEESTEARLERLGRQRPEVFDSIWSEIGFVFSISMSQVLSVSST